MIKVLTSKLKKTSKVNKTSKCVLDADTTIRLEKAIAEGWATSAGLEDYCSCVESDIQRGLVTSEEYNILAKSYLDHAALSSFGATRKLREKTGLNWPEVCGSAEWIDGKLYEVN